MFFAPVITEDRSRMRLVFSTVIAAGQMAEHCFLAEKHFFAGYGCNLIQNMV